MKKRLISLLMACVMLLMCIPAAVAANSGGDGLDVVILIDRSGTMNNTDPSGIALAATKMFADRCNSRDNSVAVVTYGYEIITETDFYDLSSDGRLDQLRAEVDRCIIQDGSEDTNTGMALEHVYSKIAARRAEFPNHNFAVLVISDGKIDIGDSKAFKADSRYPDKGAETQNMLIEQSRQAGAAAAQTCADENIPIYCLGIYSRKSNILGDDMRSWSAVTGGMYRDTDDINDVYNIIREMYLDMTGNPDSIPVTDGAFTIPANTLEANVEIVPSIAADRMTLTRPDGTEVNLSGGDAGVRVREDSHYTMIKLDCPEAGEWKIAFADGEKRNLAVYITCNLDLNMLLNVPGIAYNENPVAVKLEATKQKAPYHDPAQPARLTVTHADDGSMAAQADMTWNPADGVYEYTFTPHNPGEYRFHAEITTGAMTNVSTNDEEAVLTVLPRPVTAAQDLGDYAFTGRLLTGYTPIDHIADLRGYFNDPDHRGIVGFEVEMSEHDFITAAADSDSGTLTYTALKATSNPVTVKVYAVDALGERSEPLTGTVTVEDAQAPAALCRTASGPIKITAMLPEKNGKAMLIGLSGYFEEPNAIDGETIVGITAADRSGGKIVEASIINDELVLRGLGAGETVVTVTAVSSDSSSVDLMVRVRVNNLLASILKTACGVLLLIGLIALIIRAVMRSKKPPFAAMSSLTVTLYGDEEYEGTEMLRKYGKNNVKLSEICRRTGVFTGPFGSVLDKIVVVPANDGVRIQCGFKNAPAKEFTLRPYDARTIDIDPVNNYSIKLEYYQENEKNAKPGRCPPRFRPYKKKQRHKPVFRVRPPHGVSTPHYDKTFK